MLSAIVFNKYYNIRVLNFEHACFVIFININNIIIIYFHFSDYSAHSDTSQKSHRSQASVRSQKSDKSREGFDQPPKVPRSHDFGVSYVSLDKSAY